MNTRTRLLNIQNEINILLLESEGSNGVIDDIRSFISKKGANENSLKYVLTGLAKKLASTASTLVHKLKFWHLESENSTNKDEGVRLHKFLSNLISKIRSMIPDKVIITINIPSLISVCIILLFSFLGIISAMILINSENFKDVKKIFNDIKFNIENDIIDKVKNILNSKNKIKDIVDIIYQIVIAPFKVIDVVSENLNKSIYEMWTLVGAGFLLAMTLYITKIKET